jgi:hypothetical protein
MPLACPLFFKQSEAFMVRMAAFACVLLSANLADAQLFRVYKSVGVQTCANGQCATPQVTVQRAAPIATAVARVRENRVQASYGSAGSMAVGSVLPDGAVVMSVGPVAMNSASCNCGCPNCNCNAVNAAPAMGAPMLGISDRVKFRRSLLAAARQAKEEGSITSMEYFLLSASSRSPKVLEQLQAAVHEAAVEEGVASVGAIDWDSLVDFITKLIGARWHFEQAVAERNSNAD